MAKRSDLSHLGPDGGARMVDVGAKAVTRRSASAEAYVTVGPEIAERLRREGGLAKGNVLETARLAGIAAAKQTPALIPLCHPIALDAVEVEAALEGDRVRIRTRVRAEAKTGVEMEALTAAAVAALTVYDMVKSARPVESPAGHGTSRSRARVATGKGIEIGPVRLLAKEGGRSGRWTREESGDAAR